MVWQCNGLGFLLETFAVLLLHNFSGRNTAPAGISSLQHFAHTTETDRRVDFVGDEFSQNDVCGKAGIPQLMTQPAAGIMAGDEWKTGLGSKLQWFFP